MYKKKVVLDTNVLISAFGWEGKPREIFELVLEGKIEFIISYKQIYELQRVLDYPKFKFSKEQKIRFLTIIYDLATLVKTSGKLNIIHDDPDDNIILESAIENNAGYVISGDNHLLKLKSFKNVKIITPLEFIKIYKSSS